MTVENQTTDRFRVVRPDVLGCEAIVVVTRREDLVEAETDHAGLVAYLPDELRELERLRDHPDLAHAAHLVKKHLGARVIPRDWPLGKWCRACVAIPAETFLSREEGSDTRE